MRLKKEKIHKNLTLSLKASDLFKTLFTKASSTLMHNSFKIQPKRVKIQSLSYKSLMNLSLQLTQIITPKKVAIEQNLDQLNLQTCN